MGPVQWHHFDEPPCSWKSDGFTHVLWLDHTHFLSPPLLHLHFYIKYMKAAEAIWCCHNSKPGTLLLDFPIFCHLYPKGTAPHPLYLLFKIFLFVWHLIKCQFHLRVALSEWREVMVSRIYGFDCIFRKQTLFPLHSVEGSTELNLEHLVYSLSFQSDHPYFLKIINKYYFSSLTSFSSLPSLLPVSPFPTHASSFVFR